MGLFDHQKQAGFTLTELVFVVAILGILAAISMPVYTNYVMRGYRADAQTALMEGAVRMQRFFTTNNTFVGADGDPDAIFGGSTIIPTSAPNPFYNLSIVGVTAGTYTLQAVPAGDTQVNDECGTMTLQSNGTKTADLNTCW